MAFPQKIRQTPEDKDDRTQTCCNNSANLQESSTQLFGSTVFPWVSCRYLGVTIRIYICPDDFQKVCAAVQPANADVFPVVISRHPKKSYHPYQVFLLIVPSVVAHESSLESASSSQAISISHGGGERETRVTNFTTKIQDVTFMQILFACTYFYLKLQIVKNIFFSFMCLFFLLFIMHLTYIYIYISFLCSVSSKILACQLLLIMFMLLLLLQ